MSPLPAARSHSALPQAASWHRRHNRINNHGVVLLKRKVEAGWPTRSGKPPHVLDEHSQRSVCFLSNLSIWQHAKPGIHRPRKWHGSFVLRARVECKDRHNPKSSVAGRALCRHCAVMPLKNDKKGYLRLPLLLPCLTDGPDSSPKAWGHCGRQPVRYPSSLFSVRAYPHTRYLPDSGFCFVGSPPTNKKHSQWAIRTILGQKKENFHVLALL